MLELGSNFRQGSARAEKKVGTRFQLSTDLTLEKMTAPQKVRYRPHLSGGHFSLNEVHLLTPLTRNERRTAPNLVPHPIWAISGLRRFFGLGSAGGGARGTTGMGLGFGFTTSGRSSGGFRGPGSTCLGFCPGFAGERF